MVSLPYCDVDIHRILFARLSTAETHLCRLGDERNVHFTGRVLALCLRTSPHNQRLPTHGTQLTRCVFLDI